MKNTNTEKKKPYTANQKCSSNIGKENFVYQLENKDSPKPN